MQGMFRGYADELDSQMGPPPELEVDDALGRDELLSATPELELGLDGDPWANPLADSPEMDFAVLDDFGAQSEFDLGMGGGFDMPGDMPGAESAPDSKEARVARVMGLSPDDVVDTMKDLLLAKAEERAKTNSAYQSAAQGATSAMFKV